MNIEGILQYMVCKHAQQTSCCWQKFWIHITKKSKAMSDRQCNAVF